jgi:hypothetical protein
MISKVKKGLLIGINYTGTSSELNGCINDQENLCNFLTDGKYIKNSELTLMNDHQSGKLYPSRKNILDQFDDLVKFADQNKGKDVCLILSYSGHGSYLRDRNGDELDKRDEVLCPIDYDKSGFITDDLIKAQLVDKLHSGVKLMVLMDCCHSGTIIDLKYNYSVDKISTYTVYGDMEQNDCEVVMISGCKDSQTSADAYIKEGFHYEYQGAMTASFLACYSDNTSYTKLVNDMRRWLKRGKYSQVPQLSASFCIDVNDKLILDHYN